jgi:hypothetical protein
LFHFILNTHHVYEHLFVSVHFMHICVIYGQSSNQLVMLWSFSFLLIVTVMLVCFSSSIAFLKYSICNSSIWLSCLDSLVYFFPQLFKLFGFLTSRLWAYQKKVIKCTKFDINYLVLSLGRNIHCWTISPHIYYPSSCQSFCTDMVC